MGRLAKDACGRPRAALRQGRGGGGGAAALPLGRYGRATLTDGRLHTWHSFTISYCLPTHHPHHAAPVLQRLEARGDWRAWRALASLVLLYHHGGVLVPPARYRPRRSLDCVLAGGDVGRDLQPGLQAALPAGVLEEVGEQEVGERGVAWGPDWGLIAAPRA